MNSDMMKNSSMVMQTADTKPIVAPRAVKKLLMNRVMCLCLVTVKDVDYGCGPINCCVEAEVFNDP